jgi:hypothetical protein
MLRYRAPKTIRMAQRAAVAALAVALVSGPAHAADTLTIAPGQTVELTCETRSVVVAGEAKISKGEIRLKLTGAESQGAQAGTWAVVTVDAGHASSLAAVHKQACASGCPMQIGAKAQPMLWAPRIAMPDAMEGDAALTVIAIDPETLGIKASTYRAKDIAALEQGTCRRAQ